MSKNILVTGGCGFIGSHFVRYLLKNNSDVTVFNLDNLSYAGDTERLKDIESDGRYHFIKADLRNEEQVKKVFSEKIDIVVNFAAESHVDNSIEEPIVFGEVNVVGTLNLLNIARQKGIEKFIHISTDEVYGEIEEGRFTEDSALVPNSPYSASKAAADLFVKACIRTYDLPAIIIRPSNNYGPWQYPEKFIPVVIHNALNDKKVPVYAQGLNKREWLYVEDCAAGVNTVLERGEIGKIYNLGSGTERKNIDLAKQMLDILGKSHELIEFVKDRPGHDFRYALDSSAIAELGFKPQVDFNEGITRTVSWYKDNAKWVEGKLKG